MLKAVLITCTPHMCRSHHPSSLSLSIARRGRLAINFEPQDTQQLSWLSSGALLGAFITLCALRSCFLSCFAFAACSRALFLSNAPSMLISLTSTSALELIRPSPYPSTYDFSAYQLFSPLSCPPFSPSQTELTIRLLHISCGWCFSAWVHLQLRPLTCPLRRLVSERLRGQM